MKSLRTIGIRNYQTSKCCNFFHIKINSQLTNENIIYPNEPTFMNEHGMHTVVSIKKIKPQKTEFYFLAKAGDHH
jgi:hypothetical protein